MTALVDSYSFAMRFAFVPALDPSKPTATAKKRGVLGSYVNSFGSYKPLKSWNKIEEFLVLSGCHLENLVITRG